MKNREGAPNKYTSYPDEYIDPKERVVFTPSSIELYVAHIFKKIGYKCEKLFRFIFRK